MNALQSSFQLISLAIFMGPNDACRHRSLHMRMLLRENNATGVAVVPDADGNLLFSFFSLLQYYQRTHRSAGATEEQEGVEENENGRNGLTGASEASICCVLFIVIGEKDASPIFEISNPVREPARPSRIVLHFSADHGFMALFAFWNQVF